MRGPKKAQEGDRRTAIEIAERSMSRPSGMPDEDRTAWVEDGKAPPESDSVHSMAVLIAAELQAERNRTAMEVALIVHAGAGLAKGDHVRVADPQSKHYGKTGLVWFIRDGRVMVSMANPRSIAGTTSDSFIPEHLEKLDEPAPKSLERAVLLQLLRENGEMCENLTSAQERGTMLLEATRRMRQRIVELGGEDPGPA
jgi:hypothetical protein